MLYFHQLCHPDAAIEASYKKQTGTLLVACARCQKPIAEVLVAARRPAGP